MKHSLLFIVILLNFSVSGQTNSAADSLSTISVKADQLVSSWMDTRHAPGLALAVIQDGSIVKLTYYGQSNVETKSPVTGESVFMIASLTKQFIAAAIILLQQDGRLSLDDHPGKYIDSLPGTWDDITIRQLLSHTSGIIRDPVDYHPYMKQPVLSVIRSMYTLPLNAKPGESWLYSNAGYYVLAEIISRVSGQEWDRFILERILAPAGLNSVRVINAEDLVTDRVSGYHYNNSTRKLMNAENWIAVRPSGAFAATLKDMAAWDIFLETSPLINKEAKQLLWTPATLNNQKQTNYGFGYYTDPFLGHNRVHHDGQYPGFRSEYQHFIDDRLGIIILSNLDNSGLESLSLQIAALYKHELAPPAFKVSVSVPSQNVAERDIPITITVRAEGKTAPGSVMEMEIWDASNKPVNKQNRQNETFEVSKDKTFQLHWTPPAPGTYTVNVGIFGPRWSIPFSWNEKAAVLSVK